MIGSKGDIALLTAVEKTRLELSENTEASVKSQFGQFFTPARTAEFMANLFPEGKGECRLLDAGAGIGSLCAAFLDRWVNSGFRFERVSLDAFEIDASLHPYLKRTLNRYRSIPDFSHNIWKTDFIEAATDWISGNMFAQALPKYTHAILNPPYKKIKSNSSHRAALRRAKIETVNLYSAFVSLAIALSAPGGQIVAIIPRSFCNGPYYRPFRDYIFDRVAIQHMHLFESRDRAFKSDNVLQENIIVRLECGGQQGPVTISTSTDDTFSDRKQENYPFEQIVSPKDMAGFIHIPTSHKNEIESSPYVRYMLANLGITVSTGPVVDYRLKEYLRDTPEDGTVPLLYPCHFKDGKSSWPVSGKKPNAIDRNDRTEKWLYPNGFYCVTRRFSSKEETRRIVASVVDPIVFPDRDMLGFENHLNVFHKNRHGLSKELAYGLASFLNTTAVDDCFRRFSGHTQVNATDLRLMRYPNCDSLTALGSWAMKQSHLSQRIIDEKIEGMI